MSDLPKFVKLNEEGPREGFQIESADIPTARKIELIDALSLTGLAQIQTVSFVNPSAVPQMADADQVVEGFQATPGVRYTALWLNERGLKRALASPKLSVTGSISLTASEKFLLRNQRRTLADNLDAQHDMIRTFGNAGIPVERGAVMAAFGCNFQGDIKTATVLERVREIFDLASEHELEINLISLADSMGWATPGSIKRLVGAVRDKYPETTFNLHLHDTRGMGIANAYAGMQMGVASFDSTVGGLGGCPFAGHPGAAGNVCTEDLVFMCQEMGIETGIDLDSLVEAAHLAEDIVGHPLPGSLLRGGTLTAWRARAQLA
jgi:hydroxymethylglutaryl-CoA lyase